MSRWSEPATKSDWFIGCVLFFVGTIVAFVVTR